MVEGRAHVVNKKLELGFLISAAAVLVAMFLGCATRTRPQAQNSRLSPTPTPTPVPIKPVPAYEDVDVNGEVEPAEYRNAVNLLEAGEYERALKSFDSFLRQNAVSRWSQAALVNSGRALEGLELWDEASTRYRQVVRGGTAAPILRATALYRLSNCHEAMGDDPQVVADLTDLLTRRKFLAPEIAQGELPARLAAAYARVGNYDRAQEFYQQAEAGISKLRLEAGSKLPPWLPKTLFLMGEYSRRQVSWDDFETAVRPLPRAQIYLLEAAETGRQPWADKAAEEIGKIYNDLVTTVEGAPLPEGDPLVAKRSLQRRQWSRAALLTETLVELRAREIPGKKSEAVLKIRSSLKSVDQRLARILQERPAGEGLTESAIERKRTKLPLKSLSTDNSLERKFLKSSRDTVPHPNLELRNEPTGRINGEAPNDVPTPIHSAPATSTSEDPNL